MEGRGPVSAMSKALEKREWEVVAVCLLRGLVQAASALPPDAVHQLVEALEGDERAKPR